MQTIYKFPLQWNQSNVLTIPGGAKLVHFAIQQGNPKVWVQLSVDEPSRKEITLQVFGTGRDIPNGATHIATTVDTRSDVWHLLQLPS